MMIGYARVSTDAQALDAQLEALQSVGAGHVYREKAPGLEGTDRSCSGSWSA